MAAVFRPIRRGAAVQAVLDRRVGAEVEQRVRRCRGRRSGRRGGARSGPCRGRGRRTWCVSSGRRRARRGAGWRRRGRTRRPRRAACRGRRRGRARRRGRRGRRSPRRGRCAPPRRRPRRAPPAGRRPAARRGSRCAAGRSRAAVRPAVAISSRRPRPAAVRRLTGWTPRSASSSAVGAVAPEERDDQRRAAVAARGDVDGRAGVEQHLAPSAGGCCRRPGAARSSRGRWRWRRSRRGRAGAGRAVRRRWRRPSRAGRCRWCRGRRTSSGKRSSSARSASRSCASTARKARANGSPLSRRPATWRRSAGQLANAVLARDHGAGAVAGERRVVAAERGDGARRPVDGRGEQSVGATLVVVEVLVVGVLEPGAVGGEPLGVGLQARPAREAVLARDRQLGVAELERRRSARRPPGRRPGRHGRDPWPACATARRLAATGSDGDTTASFPVARGPHAPGGKEGSP